ncbi:MAG: DUF1800 domain-containing protein [Planctomycetes bacterium]|nr:DUF1800 domain-containing protein [Planctomycetota bacterium]
MGNGTTKTLRIAVTGCALWATGCMGGGSTTTGAPEDSMSAPAGYSADDVDHLLLRTQFGIAPASRSAALAAGLPAFVDAMLAFPTTGMSTAETAAFALLVDPADPPGLEGKFPSSNDVSDWWLYLMLHSDHPFQERLAMFWHDHFAISYTALRAEERYMMVDYLDKLRRHGIGNFKSLVLELARDPAMLEWLDGSSNVKTQPNENFAREFFELFTAGEGRGYTEADVKEAARAFTGYRNRLDATTGLRYAEFDATRKDIGAKVLFTDEILRSNPPDVDDYDLVVDATFARLDVAGWLAEKLLREFVTDAPGPALIANLAAVIRAENYEMRPVLRTLFLSSAFHLHKRTMVKMPVDYGIGLVRATGLMVAPATMRAELVSLAQLPGSPPSVFGWPQGEEWLSPAGMVERANLTRRLIGDRTFQTNNGYDVTLPAGTPDAAAVVDDLASRMAIRLDATERTTLITYLDSNVLGNGTVQPDPFDPNNPQDVSSRVRGLVYILANHPDALLR